MQWIIMYHVIMCYKYWYTPLIYCAIVDCTDQYQNFLVITYNNVCKTHFSLLCLINLNYYIIELRVYRNEVYFRCHLCKMFSKYLFKDYARVVNFAQFLFIQSNSIKNQICETKYVRFIDKQVRKEENESKFLMA